MEEDRQQQRHVNLNGRSDELNLAPYLDHGVPSLVAMDNPDDSKLGAKDQARLAPKRGSRR